MTKGEVLTIYSFLGNSIKMSALSTPETRKAFITLIREMKKAADEILTEVNVVNEPAFDGNKEEIRNKILEEPCEAKFTKIDEELLMAAISESKVDIPILTVIDSFDEIIKH
jgi:hypothetical protein